MTTEKDDDKGAKPTRFGTQTNEPTKSDQAPKAATSSDGEDKTTKLDQTVPGGRYEVGGKFVDAEGREIKDDKKDKD